MYLSLTNMSVLQLWMIMILFGCSLVDLKITEDNSLEHKEKLSKKEAINQFLGKVPETSLRSYLTRNWLRFWELSERDKKKYPFVPIKDKALIWWNKAHVFVRPKTQETPKIGRIKRRRRRRRRKCTKRREKLGKCDRPRGKRQTPPCTHIPSPPALTRMEWRRMSAAQRLSFINAFNAMATTLVPGLSITEHDLLVEQHRITNSPSAHNGAGFFTWLREYLFR